jgi:hypothetical protein
VKYKRLPDWNPLLIPACELELDHRVRVINSLSRVQLDSGMT